MRDVYVYYGGSIELVNKRPTVRTKQTILGTGYLLLQRVERRKKYVFTVTAQQSKRRTNTN